jgi:hypothetical protein
VLNDGTAYKWEKYIGSNGKNIEVLIGNIYRFHSEKYRGSNGNII